MDRANAATRNKAIALALCNHLSVDPSQIDGKTIEESDVKTLVSSILPESQDQDEVLKWAEFASSFDGKLEALNDELAQKSVLVGPGYKLSAADIIVFPSIYHFVVNLSETDVKKFPHLMRWIDYIQNSVNFGDLFEKIKIDKAPFNPPIPKKTENEPSSKKKGSGEEKAKNKNEKKTEEKKESSEKDSDCSVAILNIQIGLIRKAWKHPSADSLLVEEIDLGDGNVRQVVSGLAKFCTPDELSNRLVVLITNVKPGKLRDVMSSGLVLCASNEDHTKVEPLIPPKDAKIGERVLFNGYDGKPEEVLNPKKKQLDKITPHLYTDKNGVAMFRGVPFMTSAGPCTSSIQKATVK
ncbi:hypothetical protein LUZ60_011033 [Juncus effusus]|nr:hypothetical protein LUZ60_011033 [Juncus effusus]